MTHLNPKIMILAVALVAGGCANPFAGPFTDVTKTDFAVDAPVNPNAVQILYLRPEGAYKEVGAVVTDGWGLHDTASMHEALRDKAGPAGANAVVLIDPYFTSSGFGTRYLGYHGVAIKK